MNNGGYQGVEGRGNVELVSNGYKSRHTRLVGSRYLLYTLVPIINKTVLFTYRKTLESPLDSRKIKPVKPTGDQS